MQEKSQAQSWRDRRSAAATQRIIPNPKLKLLDQVREMMRLKHYSIHTERSYCDWIRRYIHFHGMQGRADLAGGESKIEQFLSHTHVLRVGGAGMKSPLDCL